MEWTQQEKRYRTLNNHYKEIYGKKVFKVALNGHFTCPNKDGSKGLGGCIYCSPSGSGDFAGSVHDDLREQFQSVKTMMHTKWPDAYYIAYFQANTNTYADVNTLKDMFNYALSLDEHTVGLSIATRCDALNQEKVTMLAELNQKTHVQIELGLQSMHDDTAAFINRGHDLFCFIKAVSLLRKAKLDVVVHIINGLPGEDQTMMLDTAKFLNTLDIQGVKIHMLHVMEKTALGTLYKENPFPLLSLEAYAEIVVSQIEQLNETIIIHRVTGDSPRESLIAPQWTLKKFVVMNEIDKRMRQLDTYQGKHTKHPLK